MVGLCCVLVVHVYGIPVYNYDSFLLVANSG